MTAPSLVPFRLIEKNDVSLVGVKGITCGEMSQNGFPIMPGFIITSNAYCDFLKQNNLYRKIHNLLQTIDYKKPTSLDSVSQHIKSIIRKGQLDEAFVTDVFREYLKLGNKLTDPFVSVQSSITMEDLQNNIHVHQKEKIINVHGEANLFLAIKDIWAFLFDTRAIFYLYEKKIDHMKMHVAVIVQKMIYPEKSGFMFTQDPYSTDKSKIIIEARANSLNVHHTSDLYEIDKLSLTILSKSVVTQAKESIQQGIELSKPNISDLSAGKQKITNDQILSIAALGKKLEHYFYFPQKVEWEIDGKNLYILHTCPITHIVPSISQESESDNPINFHIQLTGDPANPGIATGPVCIIHSANDIDKIHKGDILVTSEIYPDFVPALRKVAAIVTDRGDKTSYSSLIARELSIPAIVGTENGTILLKNQDIVTVNGTTGGIINGIAKTSLESDQIEEIIPTVTKIYVNLAQTDLANEVSQRQVDGIGLLRGELIMGSMGIHPKKIIHEHRQREYIRKISDNIVQICQTFSPRPVIYRLSDFTTNDYFRLLGGERYEVVEKNPLLGYHGVLRAIHDPEVFQLELDIIKRARKKMNHKNLWIMLPFVRTVKELIKIKKRIVSAGLYRSPSFKIWMMVEIPANVILLDEFIDVGIDGVSIGSTNLTTLLLGIDRENFEVAREFHEENEAVLWAFEKIIKTSQKHDIPVSFYRESVSQYSNLIDKLVKWGITSISVAPDNIESTKRIVSIAEKHILNEL